MTPNRETTTYNDAPEDLRHNLKCAIIELTDQQAEYVLEKLENLLKGS